MAENKRVPELDDIDTISDSDFMVVYDLSGDVLFKATVQKFKEKFQTAPNLGVANPVNDITALKAVNTTNPAVYKNFVLIVVGNKGIYYLDRNSALADDPINYTVVTPNVGVGRWIKDRDLNGSITYSALTSYNNSGILEETYTEFSFKFWKYINTTATTQAQREAVLGSGLGYPFENIYWTEVSKAALPVPGETPPIWTDSIYATPTIINFNNKSIVSTRITATSLTNTWSFTNVLADAAKRTDILIKVTPSGVATHTITLPAGTHKTIKGKPITEIPLTALETGETFWIIQGVKNGSEYLWTWTGEEAGGGHVIEDEGTPLTQRDNLNFIGGGVSVADSGGKTVVNIPGNNTASTITDFTEAVQDAVAALLGAGSNITLNYDDASNSLSITAASGGLDAEAVRDAIGIALVGVGNISVSVNDALDTITISTTATANSTDAHLLARANHTGTQLASTISDFAIAVEMVIPDASETVKGKLEISTTGEALAGTNDVTAMTPLKTQQKIDAVGGTEYVAWKLYMTSNYI